MYNNFGYLSEYAFDANCPVALSELLFEKYIFELRIKASEREIGSKEESDDAVEWLMDCHVERSNTIARLDSQYPHWNDEEQARELYCKAESTT